jgi:hypothetical protein
MDGNRQGSHDPRDKFRGRGNASDAQFSAQFDPIAPCLSDSEGFFIRVTAYLDDHNRKLTEYIL